MSALWSRPARGKGEPALRTAALLHGRGRHFRVYGPNDVLFPLRSDWVTSYKVMVSNDSHTWVTIQNGSGDMVSLFVPLPGWVSGSVGSAGTGRGTQSVLAPGCLLISRQLKLTAESDGG